MVQIAGNCRPQNLKNESPKRDGNPHHLLSAKVEGRQTPTAV
jgi:hypothetical protein